MEILSVNFTYLFGPNQKLLQKCNYYGPDTPDAIRLRDAISKFLLTDNFDPSLIFQIFRSVRIF